MAEVEEPEVQWAVGMKAAPDSLDLRERVQPVWSTATGEAVGIPKFLDDMAARDPPVETVGVIKGLPASVVKQAARGVISVPCLKALARLIDPAGFEWQQGELPRGVKRKAGGNGNNKVLITLKEQLEKEGVEELNTATFRWDQEVFRGVPKKGEAVSLNAHVQTLFDNTWLAMNKVRVLPSPLTALPTAPRLPPPPPPLVAPGLLPTLADPAAPCLPAPPWHRQRNGGAVGGGTPTVRHWVRQARQAYQAHGQIPQIIPDEPAQQEADAAAYRAPRG